MRFGGIVLAALLSLGACSSDPQPKEPKPSATTATPTATPPTMPARAKQDTPEGAAAFVKHYIDVFNYAASTGDASQISRLAPECTSCLKYARDFEQLSEPDLAPSDVWTPSNIAVSRDRHPIEVLATIRSEGDDEPYQLAFVLNTGAPFELREVTERRR